MEPRGKIILRGFFMKMYKKLLLGIFMAVTTLSGFAQAHPYGFNDSDYSKILETSLVSTGNNFRLKNALEKIKKGEKVYIAALGGSVTEGAGPAKFTDGYAYQFFRSVKTNYAPDDGKNIIFNDAGLSGTPSMLGKVRYDLDVVDVLGHTPDILIVEFAVNDDGTDGNIKGFEAIVRDALLANSETAVIALYAAATYGNSAAWKMPIASYYSIPQVDVLKAVKPQIDSGKIKKESYYTDTVHPTKEGHAVMNDCLMNLLNVVDKAKIDSEINVPAKSYKEPSLSGLIRITGNNDDVKITAGGFNGTDKNCQTLKKTNKSDFPQNWYKAPGSSAESFKMDIKCKNLVLTYKVQGSWLAEKFGKADIFVDGKKIGTYDGGKEGGWNNCENLLLIDENEVKNHTVEVKMVKGSEKKGFTIVCMGYSK